MFYVSYIKIPLSNYLLYEFMDENKHLKTESKQFFL